MNSPIEPDVLIIGGGVAGLWLLNHLRHQGYTCLLLEKKRLGHGQTLASQGIIHGGLKYALSGSLSGESESIAAMPTRWREALDGKGSVDLSGLPLLSDTQYLWSAGGMASRMTAFFASKMLRGRIEAIERPHFPPALASPAFKGKVYRLEDLVIDTPALLQLLKDRAQGRVLAFDEQHDHLEWNSEGVAAAVVQGARIEPGVTVLCAGEGNGALLQQAHAQGLLQHEQMQLRPLKMLVMKHPQATAFFGHCIGASNKPQLTVTSHPLADGTQVWNLGGDIAETGVGRGDGEQIAEGIKLLTRLFPWMSLDQAAFATLAINRAEPKQQQLVKPDNAYARRDKKLVLAWPTKLTLAPDMADRVEALLDPPRSQLLHLPELKQATAGRPFWESCEWVAS